MLPVKQTILHNHNTLKGNCLQACIAALFELSIDKVPHFVMQDEWEMKFLDFVYEYSYIYEGYAPFSEYKSFAGVNGYYIVGGVSPRNEEMGHAVIYNNGQLIFDPHPDNSGLSEISGIFLIKKTDKLVGYNPWRLFC